MTKDKIENPSTPEALVEFMLREWGPRQMTAVAVPHAERFAARRRKVAELFPGDTLVFPTGSEKIRSNDTAFRFRPSSDFYYLTGNTEQDCVLVLGPDGREILFVDPAGRDDHTFFTDHAKGELWVGPRLGIPGSRVRYGINDCRSLKDLGAFLDTVRRARVIRGFSPQVDAAIPQRPEDADLATAVSEMRLIKDDVEIAELEHAIAVTRRGFEDVIRHRCKNEREVEGIFNLRARCDGNDVGYHTIAAGGAHACTLHWTRNDGALDPNSLLLLDAGVENESLYTADITRTIPVSGKYSSVQRQVYELVLKAQRAGIAEVRPGADFLEPHRTAMHIIASELCAWGILQMPLEEAMRTDRLLYRRYTLHNTSHMLGLDVHDCVRARPEEYKLGKLRAGMVLTVEPGLYFQSDDLTVPQPLRGIGVRIEDDILVTDSGHRNLSAEIPSGADEVEAWIASLRS
jgi:Xaa-Pro aminopeptidase